MGNSFLLLSAALIVLQGLKGVGLAAQRAFIETVDHNTLDSLDMLSAAMSRFLQTGKRYEKAEAHVLVEKMHVALSTIEQYQNQGIEVVSIFDVAFPNRAKVDGDYPVLLFCRGNVSLLNAEKALAVIGTRDPEEFVAKSVYRIATRAVESGFCVISGLALGCDAIAHEATLDAEGETVAVLAGCVLKPSPAANRELAERIVKKNGLLVSEYPPGTSADRFRLVARDRLQSMFSDGLVLGQSTLTGGSMHATKATLGLIRPVGAVVQQGRVFEGNTWAIDNGAYALSDRDVLVNFFEACQLNARSIDGP